MAVRALGTPELAATTGKVFTLLVALPVSEGFLKPDWVRQAAQRGPLGEGRGVAQGCLNTVPKMHVCLLARVFEQKV